MRPKLLHSTLVDPKPNRRIEQARLLDKDQALTDIVARLGRVGSYADDVSHGHCMNKRSLMEALINELVDAGRIEACGR